MTDGDQIVECRQCGWPIRRCEQWAPLVDPATYALTGFVHLETCALDYVTSEPRSATQRRRMGRAGAN